MKTEKTTKIATWNINSINIRLNHLLDFLSVHEPDIVALQETKCTDINFPKEIIEKAGYRVIFAGKKSYNGVALLSKYSSTSNQQNVEYGFTGITENSEINLDEDPENFQKRVISATISTTISNIRIINLYAVNGQEIGSEKFASKIKWFSKLEKWLNEEITKYQNLVVLGDFNIAPDDNDVHDPILWKDKILCSDIERDFFSRLLKLGLSDSFRIIARPNNKFFSWWDYRNNSFEKNLGMRIDHILISNSINARFKNCEILSSFRKLEKPSDHAPVILSIC